jgi:ABC-type transport system involved in multi-copper enzyme maturation permease subunit
MMSFYSIPDELYGSDVMKRFFLLLLNEFRLSRTALIVTLIAIVQPTLMFVLMADTMVVPTFDLNVVQPETKVEQGLVSAMKQVGSPIGAGYINPILVNQADTSNTQVIEVVERDGVLTVVQHYGYIDSNLVKNLRNRLTSALLVLWNNQLGDRAITVNEHPWLPRDIPFTVYLGMAMMTFAAFLAAAMIGGYLMAQEFENGTILEYRLCPISLYLLLAAKITRLVLTGLIAAALMYIALGLKTGVWSSSTLLVFVILLPLILIAACIGLSAGMLTRSSLPSFLEALTSAFLFWLIGGGFGLAAGFPSILEKISRLIPNTPIIEMLFPYYYFGRVVAANPVAAQLQLALYCLVLLILVVVVYRQRVLKMQR